MTKQETAKWLRERVKRGDNLITQVTHISRSGMSRRIRVYKTLSDGRLLDLTFHLSKLLGYKMNDKGLFVSGCGMDMCYDLIADKVSFALFNKDYQLNNQTI